MYYTPALADYIFGIENNPDTRSQLNKYIDTTESKNIRSFATKYNVGTEENPMEVRLTYGITYNYDYSYDGIDYKNQTGFLGSQSEFNSILGMMGGSTGNSSYDDALSAYVLSGRNVGGNDIASNISIYPVNFKNKNLATDYLDKWNGDETLNYSFGGVEYEIKADDRSNVKYSDTLELIISLINQMIQIVTIALIAFSAVSLIVSTIMIGIITYVSVVERTKEIGIIRAMGGRKRDVKNLFTAETFIIGLVAGIIGVAITYVISIVVNLIFFNMLAIPTIAALPWWQAVIMVAISVCLTLVSGLSPASAAAKKDPVVALRTE